ncbi:MAG: (Fe-S)-binding protein [Syntrophales bacterium]|jgi:Fe-S oxidoreductase|nr:(Fe-S)-binding protein [Syntrophales bacterium]MCK9527991.1 (Fe-S)-binding protein [Syntrophales bacterium]MDX9921432.1 (Fe-S)-binding protein [Syntrophales bacterium]
MFHEEKCDFCGDCLARCHYLPFDKKSGSEAFRKLVEGEDSQWLYDCVTCAACNEYCPKDARPFDLILQKLEALGDFSDPGQKAQMADRFKAEGEPRPVPKVDRAMSLCVMEGSMPWAIQGKIFEGMPLLKGRHYFCNVLFVHMGDESIMRDRMQTMVDNLAGSGAKEIVVVHDDCYAVLKGIAPEYGIDLPFRPLSILEHLRDFLEEHQTDITKLDMKVAYQRPCSSRFTGEKEHFVDEIFSMIGVERVKREYDGVNALCCGVEMAGPNLKLFPRGKDFEPFRVKNVADAKSAGADAMVYLCPLCFRTLGGKAKEAGMSNLMITDLCRLAIGETLPEDKPY